MLIDTHTHFYDEWLLPDAEAAIARALEAGVGKMIQVDVDSRERDALWALNDAHPGVLYPMLGLYPGSVDDRWEEEIALLPAYRDRGIVAIGEIGLDYHEGTEWKEQQKEALRVQLELAATSTSGTPGRTFSPSSRRNAISACGATSIASRPVMKSTCGHRNTGISPWASAAS